MTRAPWSWPASLGGNKDILGSNPHPTSVCLVAREQLLGYDCILVREYTGNISVSVQLGIGTMPPPTSPLWQHFTMPEGNQAYIQTE